MSYVYAIAIVNRCAFFAVERWVRSRLLNLSSRLLFERCGCVPLHLPLLLYLPSLFFGTGLLTLSNLYWLGDVLEEHAFLFGISCASHFIIHVLCDFFHLTRRYLNVRRLEEENFKLGKLWGLDESDVHVIRVRNGGLFPEDPGIDTLREFRIRTDLGLGPHRIITPRTRFWEFIGEDVFERLS